MRAFIFCAAANPVQGSRRLEFIPACTWKEAGKKRMHEFNISFSNSLISNNTVLQQHLVVNMCSV